jgi:hypothetical protein
MQSNNFNRQVIDLKLDDKGYTVEGQNTYGYCKIETRGKKCRIKLSVDGLLSLNNFYKTYLVKVDEYNTDLVPIGIIQVDNNNYGSLNISTDTNKVMGTNNTINDFSIIVVSYKDNNNYKFPIVGFINQVNGSWKKNIKEKNYCYKKKEIIKKEVLKESISQKNNVTKNQKINNKEVIKESKENNKSKKIDNINTDSCIIKEPIEIEDIGNQTFDIIKKHFNKNELNKIYDNIFIEYPKMNPFIDKYSEAEWVRIEPADIIYFPIDTWLLTNNTFLLNAYRRYKHLILGRKKEYIGEKPYFMLGVPNIYYPKDKVVAYFYGFKDFVCCSGAKTKSGEYGYWIIKIESPM